MSRVIKKIRVIGHEGRTLDRLTLKVLKVVNTEITIKKEIINFLLISIYISIWQLILEYNELPGGEGTGAEPHSPGHQGRPVRGDAVLVERDKYLLDNHH